MNRLHWTLGKLKLIFQRKGKFIEDSLWLLSCISFILVLLDLGFGHLKSDQYSRWFSLLNVFVFILQAIRIYQNWSFKKLEVRWYAGQTAILILTALALLGETFFHHILISIQISEHTSLADSIYHAIFILLFLEELSNRLFAIQRAAVNGPFLLLLSFAFIILVGSLLLMLPSATTRPISFVNALFTSTSAVCVTGLTVLDTAKDFTHFGKWIILILIQTGGLGILTFTNMVGLIFSGSTSFQNQLLIQNMLNVKSLGDAMKALVRIVVITLIIEFAGALFIYFSVDSGFFTSGGDRFFFALFHSISAFCNAGFSTLGNDNMYHEAFRYAYTFQLIVAFLIIFGGIGFGILLNILSSVKARAHQLYSRFFKHETYRFRPPIINLNTTIVIITTLILIVGGTVLYFIFEYHNVLRDHPTLYGKLVQSFFGSVTPRTAGFNTVDIAKLTIPTLMIYLLLMWIGGSPGSTAGGIKTSVFAVATINIFNQIMGKERFEIGKRELPSSSVHKTFAIISLSLIALGMAATLIVIKDGSKFDLLKIVFETFSALGTVGLSMGITPFLSDFSKVVLVITMFIGRVGFISILIGMIRLFTRDHEKSYRYPKEELFIT
jgi:potassium uptake TrkH family protein